MRIFRNFTIYDPWHPKEPARRSDLLVDDEGIIRDIPRSGIPETAEIIEGNGRWLVPGFCDTHCNIGEPGLEYRETIQTASQAALAGGFTTLFMYPNTRPVVDNLQTFEYLQSKISNSPIHIQIVAALTKGCEGQFIAPVKSFVDVGVRWFSDGYLPVQSSVLMKRTCDYVSMYDGLIIQNPEDKVMAGQGVLNDGYQAVRLGLPGIPSISESVMVHRDSEIARATGVRIHFNNLTTRQSLDAFRFHKSQGADISCSISPFYFTLSEDQLDWYNTNFKLSPPLRSDEDRLSVLEAIQDGLVSMISSAHTPQSEIEKTTDFLSSPVGAISLETVFAASFTALVKPGILTLEGLTDLLVVQPRRRFGLAPNPLDSGSVADFAILDPFETVTVLKDSLRSKSKNTPFINQRFIGSIDAVFTKNKLHTFHEAASSDYSENS